ncbi:hypothetical protein [Peribacillus frigoritolerans]|uniref:hypothetical protein n=1 Tax=Peribacillus frigoritolerans TaxID=450367 RepID=UPI003F7D6347
MMQRISFPLYNGTTITHDKNGNLTNDGKRILVYDRLVEVKEGTTKVAKYQYNSEGLRISKTTGSTTVNYTYDENANVVLETDQSGAVLASYVYDNGNRPLTMTKSGKTYTFHGKCTWRYYFSNRCCRNSSGMF